MQLLSEARVAAVAEGRELPAALDGLLAMPTTFAPKTLQDDGVVELMTAAMDSVFGEWSGPGRTGQYEADTEWIRRPDPWQDAALAETTVPLLVVAHEFDLFFPPALLARKAEKLPKGEFLEIKGCGHAGMEDIGGHREAVLKFFGTL